jgi:hypothetical protein
MIHRRIPSVWALASERVDDCRFAVFLDVREARYAWPRPLHAQGLFGNQTSVEVCKPN